MKRPTSGAIAAGLNIMPIAAMFAFVLLAYGLIGTQAQDDELEQTRHYCDMTALHAADATTGWPPYDKSINCSKEIIRH